jgi:exodeoxyribonuclease V alpha subunit
MLKWEPAEGKFIYGRKKPLSCDLLVVDEVSMLDLPLAVYLFRAVKRGSTVVLVGDADQLPSVGPGKVLNDLIASREFPVTHLSKIFRQGEGSRIIVNAHAVNSGHVPQFPKASKDELTDFYWIEQEEPEAVTDIIAKMVGERIPARFGFNPANDIQVLTPMNRGACGTIALNALLQTELNGGGHKPQFRFGDRVFRSGDKIMQVSNNYDKNVFNGDMGRIYRIDASEKIFSVYYDSTLVNYEFTEADQITHAYAITVHKSQGSEFPAVIVPMLTQHYVMLQRKLLYTAMTRAKKLLILIGSMKAVGMAVRNTSAEPRYSMLLQRLSETFRSFK